MRTPLRLHSLPWLLLLLLLMLSTLVKDLLLVLLPTAISTAAE